MRISHAVVVVTVAFLASSEALSTRMDDKVSTVATHDGPRQRLLRIPHTAVENEDDSEERGLQAKDYLRLDAYADKLGINVEKAMKNTAYLGKVKDKYGKYQTYLNQLIEKRKSKGLSTITHEHHG
ncbi:hypothetical protein GN958_ATG19195 [Phytophthora infestans]|uniref:RxLR effector protein n=1 Tax=Phytophthora infestans TaxID=4787 RepID=A0A8S9TX48_PHYIN|nr:hypothetical protein GN958_ATG19195 [Phytophthora infestans]